MTRRRDFDADGVVNRMGGEQFAMVPASVLDAVETHALSAGALLVWLQLIRASGADGAFPKRSTLARRTGLHEDTIRRVVRELETAGFVERVPCDWNGVVSEDAAGVLRWTGRQVANIYRLLRPYSLRPGRGGESAPLPPVEGGRNGPPGGGETVPPRGGGFAPPISDPIHQILNPSDARALDASGLLSDILTAAQARMNRQTWQCWLAPLVALGFTDGGEGLLLEVKNTYVQEWVSENYQDFLEGLLETSSGGRVRKIRYQVQAPATPAEVEHPRQAQPGPGAHPQAGLWPHIERPRGTAWDPNTRRFKGGGR